MASLSTPREGIPLGQLALFGRNSWHDRERGGRWPSVLGSILLPLQLPRPIGCLGLIDNRDSVSGQSRARQVGGEEGGAISDWPQVSVGDFRSRADACLSAWRSRSCMEHGGKTHNLQRLTVSTTHLSTTAWTFCSLERKPTPNSLSPALLSTQSIDRPNLGQTNHTHRFFGPSELARGSPSLPPLAPRERSPPRQRASSPPLLLSTLVLRAYPISASSTAANPRVFALPTHSISFEPHPPTNSKPGRAIPFISTQPSSTIHHHLYQRRTHHGRRSGRQIEVGNA